MTRRVLRDRWRERNYSTWLSCGEQEVYSGFRDPQRCEGWFFARILLKQLILEHLTEPYEHAAAMPGAAIQIHSRDGLGRATRPRAMVHGQLQPWSLSVSHTDHSILVALSVVPGVSVGVDVTPVHRPGSGFREAWLTRSERLRLLREGSPSSPRLASTFWAIKEAFYKAVNAGEAFAPRSIRVDADPRAGVYSVRTEGTQSDRSEIFVEQRDEEIVAIVSAVRPEAATSP